MKNTVVLFATLAALTALTGCASKAASSPVEPSPSPTLAAARFQQTYMSATQFVTELGDKPKATAPGVTAEEANTIMGVTTTSPIYLAEIAVDGQSENFCLETDKGTWIRLVTPLAAEPDLQAEVDPTAVLIALMGDGDCAIADRAHALVEGGVPYAPSDADQWVIGTDLMGGMVPSDLFSLMREKDTN